MKRPRSRRLALEQFEPRLTLATRVLSLPSLSLGDVQVTEGDSGTKLATLTLNLSSTYKYSVTVGYKTANGTANYGADYNTKSGNVTFRPGELTKTIAVEVRGDITVENDEYFSILVSSVRNATLANSSAKVVVHDNDLAPVVAPIPAPAPEPTPTPAPTPAPAPTQVFGATGALGPQTGVIAPTGAVVFSTAMSTSQIQTAINNAASSATFFFKAGTYQDLSISPKSGQKFIGEKGAILTSATQAFAFRGGASNVTLSNLVIDGYRPQWPSATVVTGANWLLDNLEIRNSSGAGVAIYDGSQLTDSYIHHNAQIGLKAEGANLVVRNNEVAFNNPLGAADVYWEAGGSKFWDTSNVLIERNTFHDNIGQGIWLDYNNRGGTVRDNWSYNHTLSGIFQEIGGSLVIERNLVENNGIGYSNTGWLQGAGICVEASTDVIIRNNVVRNNANGITIIATNRDNGEFISRNIVVQYNTITMSKGRSGVVWDYNAASNPWSTVFFDYNTYTLSGSAGFAWNATYSNAIQSWSQWRTAGNDLRGMLQ